MLTVKHNGFELTYSDNEDKWSCWPVRLEDKSLAKLKQKINKFIANRLKTARILVGVRDTWGSDFPKKKQVVGKDAGTGEYWVVELDGDRNRRERVKAEQLFPWTADMDAKRDEYRAMQEEAQAMMRKAAAFIKALKSANNDAVADMLIDLSKVPDEE